MTNKEQKKDYKKLTIRAHQDIAWRYRNPKGLIFFDMLFCPLCEIHHKFGECRGCPLADVDGGTGCWKFNSYFKAQDNYYWHYFGKLVEEAFEARAQFHEKVIKIIENWPESRFTPEDWTYSGKEIPREW